MNNQRKIGPVTTSAAAFGTSGGGVGLALAQIVIFIWPNLKPIEGPLSILFGMGLMLLGSLYGGWRVRRPEDLTEAAVVNPSNNPPGYDPSDVSGPSEGLSGTP